MNAEQTADVEKLLEKLEEDDDVQNVYHTMEASEEEAEEIIKNSLGFYPVLPHNT